MARGSAKPAGTAGGRYLYILRWDQAAPDGRRRQRQETYTAPHDARDARAARRHAETRLAALVAAAAVPVPAASATTVAAHLTQWLDTIAPTVAGSTLYAYRGTVRRVLIPALGHLRLDRIGPNDAERLYAAHSAHGDAPATVRHYHTVLHRALADAVRWRLLPTNPIAGARPPRQDAGHPPHWSAAEARAFLAAATGDPLEALWRLALDGGLRIGEILALAWDDADPDRAVVTVRRTLTRTAGGATVIGDRPKSSSGRRTVDLSPATVAVLRAHRAREAARRIARGQRPALLFAANTGVHLAPSTVRDRLDRLCRAAGVPWIGCHGLRHTSATLIVAAGVPLNVVQRRLGHANLAQTMRYAHVLDAGQRAAADAIGAALAGDPCGSMCGDTG